MKPLPKGLIIGGIMLGICAPMAGFLFTTLGMVRAFHLLNDNGIADPKGLAQSIGWVLDGTMAGLLVAVIGVALAVLGAVIHWMTKPRLVDSTPRSG